MQRKFENHINVVVWEDTPTYLKTDVLLLTNVFESYRSVCLHHYKLDPAHYYTAPAFSWYGCTIRIAYGYQHAAFFRKGTRGGVSTCVQRKAVANNQFVDHHDPTSPKSFIMYLDATNLYGFSISEYFPISDFKWLTEKEIHNFDVMKVSNTSEVGYHYKLI